MGKPIDLVQGTLDFLILKAIELEPKHGWGIAKRIQQISGDVLKVPQGSLYPALYRLEEQGLIDSEWRATENNRKAKFYKLTRKGRSAASVPLRPANGRFVPGEGRFPATRSCSSTKGPA